MNRNKNAGSCIQINTELKLALFWSSFLVIVSHGGSADVFCDTVGLVVSDQTLDRLGGVVNFRVGNEVIAWPVSFDAHSTSSAKVHISFTRSNRSPSPQSY